MRWILALALLAGCGGEVTEQGMLDEHGCPTQAADWSGTATLMQGCAGAPSTIAIANGTYNGTTLPPFDMNYEQARGVCIATFIHAMVSCGDALYQLEMTPR